jgi:hypothetical protein
MDRCCKGLVASVTGAAYYNRNRHTLLDQANDLAIRRLSTQLLKADQQ